MNNTTDTPAAETAQASGSAKTRVKITMRIVEEHTIEREVDEAEFLEVRKYGDPTHWLTEQFQHDPIPDSDINTTDAECERWEIIPSQNILPVP